MFAHSDNHVYYVRVMDSKKPEPALSRADLKASKKCVAKFLKAKIKKS